MSAISKSTCRVTGLLGLAFSLAGCVGVATPAQYSGYGHTCYAGAYTCQLGGELPAGTQCTCPGIGAPSYGAVR